MKNLIVFAGLAIFCPAITRADWVVIDDFAIERTFESKVGALAKAGGSIHGRDGMVRALAAAKGKKARLAMPSPNTQPANIEDGVVVLGTLTYCENCGKWEKNGIASGWVLSEDGLIVTNYHVIAPEVMDKATLGVLDRQGRAFAVKEVVAYDINSDIAILKVETGDIKLTALALAAEPPASGAAIHVISHPDGRYFSLSKGNVTRYHRQPVDEASVEKALAGEEVPMATWMSVSADFGVGSSGGTVLDDRNQVVGMVSLTTTVIATTGEEKEGDPLPAEGVQMVFKDCVPLPALRALVEFPPPAK